MEKCHHFLRAICHSAADTPVDMGTGRRHGRCVPGSGKTPIITPGRKLLASVPESLERSDENRMRKRPALKRPFEEPGALDERLCDDRGINLQNGLRGHPV